ncbi:hypothetical protein LCGC14_1052030 [marine sediment metagenome]|uniref:Uncharacterized protein n=1 Tax=marine sediment metagenome TaxID=412755 RepID=A0A0F9QUL9_9ZZZZ|nr:hypothetical protein [bacterium]
MLKLRFKKKKKNISIGIFLLIIIFTVSISFINRNVNFVDLNNTQRRSIENRDTPKISAFWASINITNYQLNNTRHLHSATITIKGNLKYNNGTGVKFTDIALFVDSTLYPQFNNITDLNGDFQIEFRIPFSFDIFSLSGYKIQANVTDNIRGNVFKENFLMIFAKTTSFLNASYTDNPYVPGENLALSGYLRYYNENGMGIPNAQINYTWYNRTQMWSSSSFLTSATDGSISQNIPIPADVYSQTLNLNLSYSGNFPYINSSQKLISINVFRDIDCVWSTETEASEGSNITISGQILYNNSLKISNRTLMISYDGRPPYTTVTDANGFFTYTYTIPDGTGNKSIQIGVVNTPGKQLNSITYINITAKAAYIPSGSGEFPFLVFSLVFFPILAGIVAVLAVFGYRYYKKQEKESHVVNLPLESKLINLKILKDSGRLEESLSYLFNAVFMDLIDARYNKVKKENETIRDFAIISVKELKLTPSAIYPFIQTVEKIIYGKPFLITEKDFYSTCELFSPIYFQLTGHNFDLNF